MDEAGFGKEELSILQKLIDAEKSDLFDVLEYVLTATLNRLQEKQELPQHKQQFLHCSTINKKSLSNLY